jgi:hypothetical protein
VVHVGEAGQLAVLVWDISMVLVDLGMPPILRTPQDPGMVDDVLECMWEAHALASVPETRHRLLSYCCVFQPSYFSFLPLVFCFLVCKYLETWCIQCLCILEPGVTILSSVRIRVGCRFCSA